MPLFDTQSATTYAGSYLSMKVLLIEDSETQAHLVRALFDDQDEADCTLHSVGDLHSGIEALAENQYDAVLLDLTLPDSSGVESCKRVHASAPTVPIVVLTGIDDQDLALATLQEGAEDYLVKGDIDSRLLVRAIRYAMERKRISLALKDAHDLLEARVEERTAQLKKMQEEANIRQEELAHAARLNTLGELASGIAHELNQPLMAIIGFADTCLEMVHDGNHDNDMFEDLLQDAGTEARRAAQIIKRMRRLVGRHASDHKLSDVNQTIADTIPLIRPGMGVSIREALQESLPQASIDRIQIQQVILNLASNAVHAMNRMDSEDRKLTIRSGQEETEPMIFVEVCDNGPGLEQEDLDRLFEPFFSRKPDGLGLGLSISQSIVESHGGRLVVHRNADRGLTFRFTIPIDA